MRIQNAETLTSHGNVEGRKIVVDLLEAGMRGADPYTNTLKLMRVEGSLTDGKLIVGNPDFEPTGAPKSGPEVFDLARVGRIFVFGAAKGVQYPARAIEEVLGDRLTGGHVIAKHGDDHLLEKIGVTYGSHPVPDEGCVIGCQKIIEMCEDLREEDLVFTIVGNGVSSLLTLPAPGITLDEVRQITYKMQIEKGAPTADLNTIRNNIDMLKGGRISRYIQPAFAVHILAYEPNGNAPDQNNGWDHLMHTNRFLHTLPSYIPYESAINNLKKWDAWDDAPRSIKEHLLRADPALAPVKAEEFEQWRFRVFGVNPRRLGIIPSIQKRADELGLQSYVLSPRIQAEAREVGYSLADIARAVERRGEPFEPPCVLITSGELLVTVGKETGIGGRNQEYALAAGRRIAGSEHIVIGAVDSDGTDGPGAQFGGEGGLIVDCLAGGIVDGYTAAEAERQGIDLHDYLRRHDTSIPLWRLCSGVLASHNIAMGDINVIYISGRSKDTGLWY